MATQSTCKSALSCYALRLKPGEELYSSLLKCKKDNNLQAPFIMTCCGSLTKATLRLAASSRENPDNVRERCTILHVSVIPCIAIVPHCVVNQGVESESHLKETPTLGPLRLIWTCNFVAVYLTSVQFILHLKLCTLLCCINGFLSTKLDTVQLRFNKMLSYRRETALQGAL